MRQKASTRTRRFTAAMAATLLAPALLVTGTTSSATAAEPTGVSFTLEGCKLAEGGTLPNGEGKYICPDAGYTTGNLGKSWNELDLVPYRVIAEAGNAAPSTQTYTVAVALDSEDAGAPGYDVLSEPELNDGKSHDSCELSVGPELLTTSFGGVDESRYRLLTIKQPKNSTCVVDYYGRLALGSHMFPGSSLHANLANENLGTAGIGSKEVSIPVKEISPQELRKDMSATQGADYTWNLTKGATPTEIEIANTCDVTGPSTANVEVTVSWTRNTATPGAATVTTNIYARNPAARVITVNVTDEIYGGSLTPGQGTLLEAESTPPAGVDVAANTEQLVLTHTFTAPASTTTVNDVATATYTDKVTGIPVPGTTEAKAFANVQMTGPITNETAVVTDAESISGSGLDFKVNSASTGSFTNYPVLGTYTTGPVSWSSGTVNSSGSATFQKTIRAAKGTIEPNGLLSDTAVLTTSGGVTHQASATTDTSVDTKASLTIDKTISDVLQGTETASFTFKVYKKSDLVNSVAQRTITFTAGQTAKAAPVITGLAPDEYVVKETATAAGFTTDSDKNVDLRGSICAGTASFANTALPANASVKKVTDPAGEEAGWDFTLTKNGTPIKTVATTGAGFIGFGVDLGEGSYTVEETLKNEWFEVSNSGCSFSVNLPGDANKTFECTFTNRKKSYVNVVKTTKGAIDPTRTWTFKLYAGAHGSDSTSAFLSSPVATDDTFGKADGKLTFGGKVLDSSKAYTICETGVPAGYTVTWMFGSITLTPYNPNLKDNPPANLGNLCVDFGAGTALPFTAGSTVIFDVDNDYPEGGQRTIGYWKNWNTCTNGNQASTAAKNGGAAEGFWLLDNVLPQLIGDLDVDTCATGVDILSKASLDGKKRASDAAYGLAAQLLAAKANVAAGAGTCPAATAAIEAGQDLLDEVDFNGTGEYLPPKGKSALRTTALNLAHTLDMYNNGLLCNGS